MAGNKGAQQLLVLTAAAASAAAGCYFYSENHQNQNPKSGHPGHLKEMGHHRTDLSSKLPSSDHTSQHMRDSKEDSNDTNRHEQGIKNHFQFARVPEEDYKREAEDAQEEKDLEDAKHDVIEKVFDDDAKKDVNYVISKIIF